MNEEQRKIIRKIRMMSNEQAVEWFRQQYPICDIDRAWQAFDLLSHRPWKKKQRDELVDYYCRVFETQSCASSRPIKVFVLMMPVSKLCMLLARHLPQNRSHLELLKYNAIPVLRHHSKTEKDYEAVTDLNAMLKAQANITFIKWIWWEDNEDMPLFGYSKVGQDDYEIEKFEFFPDKTWSYSTSMHDTGRTRLGDQPIGGVEMNNRLSLESKDRIWMWEISEQEYEAAKMNHIVTHELR